MRILPLKIAVFYPFFAENTQKKLRNILSEIAENTYKIEYFYLLHNTFFYTNFAAIIKLFTAEGKKETPEA